MSRIVVGPAGMINRRMRTSIESADQPRPPQVREVWCVLPLAVLATTIIGCTCRQQRQSTPVELERELNLAPGAFSGFEKTLSVSR